MRKVVMRYAALTTLVVLAGLTFATEPLPSRGSHSDDLRSMIDSVVLQQAGWEAYDVSFKTVGTVTLTNKMFPLFERRSRVYFNEPDSKAIILYEQRELSNGFSAETVSDEKWLTSRHSVEIGNSTLLKHTFPESQISVSNNISGFKESVSRSDLPYWPSLALGQHLVGESDRKQFDSKLAHMLAPYSSSRGTRATEDLLKVTVWNRNPNDEGYEKVVYDYSLTKLLPVAMHSYFRYAISPTEALDHSNKIDWMKTKSGYRPKSVISERRYICNEAEIPDRFTGKLLTETEFIWNDDSSDIKDMTTSGQLRDLDVFLRLLKGIDP